MPRQQNQILIHPKREQIDADLLGDTSLAQIARSYDVSYNSLFKYRQKYFKERVKAVVAQHEERHKLTIAERIERIIGKLELTTEAAGRALEDPEHPGEYTLDPRATEVHVIYEEVREADDRVVTKRAPLQTLLEMVQRDLPINLVQVQPRGTDPVNALTRAADSASKQLKLVWEMYRESKEEERNDAAAEAVWEALRDAIIEVTGDDPKRRRLAREILDAVRRRFERTG